MLLSNTSRKLAGSVYSQRRDFDWGRLFLLGLYFGVVTPGRERDPWLSSSSTQIKTILCASVVCSWKLRIFGCFCFETANRRRALGPRSQGQSSVCIILWQLLTGPQIRETPRTNLKGTSGSYFHGLQPPKRVALRAREKLFNILDSNAVYWIVHNVKRVRLGALYLQMCYFKPHQNWVSVRLKILRYLTFYLAFVL